MKKLILIIGLAALGSGFNILPEKASNYQDVYICNSKGGKKYHFIKNCRGLTACKAPVKKLSISEARKMGKTICGWED